MRRISSIMTTSSLLLVTATCCEGGQLAFSCWSQHAEWQIPVGVRKKYAGTGGIGKRYRYGPPQSVETDAVIHGAVSI